jgi:hypothetical protein
MLNGTGHLPAPNSPLAPQSPQLDLSRLGGWHDSSQDLRRGLFVQETHDEQALALCLPGHLAAGDLH